MQEWYFLSSQCVEKVCLLLQLFMINYSSIKYDKENTLSNCSVIFLLVKIIFSKILCRFLK